MFSYRPGLDGLRSVAVYLVLFFHAGLPWVTGGFIGVDLFFVLSGFLVTNVILAEIDTHGRLGLGGFYSRRVRRLLPAAVAVVVATCVMFLILTSVVRRLPLIADARSALLYYANWHFLGASNDYFASDLEPSPFLHFWSLSIEEQFYFVFPLLIFFLSRGLKKKWERNLGIVVAVLMVASIVAQLVWSQINVNHAYYGTDARLYQLLAGSLLAIVLRARPKLLPKAATSVVLLVGLLGIAALGSNLLDISPTWRGLGAMVTSVFLIGGITMHGDGWLGRLLSRPTPVYLGKISYGTYLWHWPVIVLMKEVLKFGFLEVAAISFVLSTALAALSFQVFESPIRRTPLLKNLRWQTVVVGIGLSAVVAVTLVPSMMESERKPVALKGEKSKGGLVTDNGGNVKVPAGVDWKAVSDDTGKSRSCTADDVARCTVVKGKSGLHVVLVGDSHAKMLGPVMEKLAEEHDFTLSMNIVSGCQWTTGLVNLRVSEQSRATCLGARETWYRDVLPKLKPDVLLMVQKPRDSERVWGGNLVNRDGTKQSLDEMLESATTRTLAQLEKRPEKIVLMEGVLGTSGSRTLTCLAGAERVGECAVPLPREAPLTDSGYRLAAAADPGQVSTVNINQIVCPQGPVCMPMIDDVPVWRDPNHLTVSFTMAHRKEIWDSLRESGAFGK